MERECQRYGLRIEELTAALAGEDPLAEKVGARRAWDVPILLGAVGIFVWLAIGTERPPIAMNLAWVAALLVPSLLLLGACGWLLWKRTKFS